MGVGQYTARWDRFSKGMEALGSTTRARKKKLGTCPREAPIIIVSGCIILVGAEFGDLDRIWHPRILFFLLAPNILHSILSCLTIAAVARETSAFPIC